MAPGQGGTSSKQKVALQGLVFVSSRRNGKARRTPMTAP
jgi:hypothetical protein